MLRASRFIGTLRGILGRVAVLGLALGVATGVLLDSAPAAGQSGEQWSSTYLPNMTWVDVEAALERSDMVIMPLGNLEQHGPHDPIGTDYYDGLVRAKMIGERADVVVAPSLFVGYAPYHLGFPGSISISQETMVQVLFEVAESLIHHGFRRILVLNEHGGNEEVVDDFISKVNHETEAYAVNVGLRSRFEGVGTWWEDPFDLEFDSHAGIIETSLMLYLTPDLVRMDRAAPAEITYPPELQKVYESLDQHPELSEVLSAGIFTPEESGKETMTHQISSNGVYSSGDPRKATAELGKKYMDEYMSRVLAFIEAWDSVHER